MFTAPSFSHLDGDGLSSAAWLLLRGPSVQDHHLLLPYIASPGPLQPPTQMPHVFGVPLYFGGWKNSRSSWLDIDPIEARLDVNTSVGMLPNCRLYAPCSFLLTPDSSSVLNPRSSQYTEHYRMTYSVGNTADNSSTDGDHQGTYTDTTATYVSPPT